jgi:hypothetical protein
MNENRPAPSNQKSAPRLLARLLALAALLLTLAAPTLQARAQAAPEERTLNFSAVGVARGQAARLTVYWTRVSLPDPCLPPDPCRVGPFNATLSFYDAEGRVVARQEATLPRGRTATLTYAPLDLPPGARAYTRAVVEVEPDPSDFIPCIIPAVEVFNDGTGRTTLFYPGAMIGE